VGFVSSCGRIEETASEFEVLLKLFKCGSRIGVLCSLCVGWRCV